MDSPNQPWLVRKALDLVVGLETGILGGLAMLVWFALVSLLMGQDWWAVLNLFASEAYRGRAIHGGAGWVTVAGAAVHLCLAGVVGAIAGLVNPGGRLFGLGVAIAWYLLSILFLWKRVAPLVPLYVHYAVLMTGYFLYGSVLGLHASLRRGVDNSGRVNKSVTL
jgi:hypothetical protein